MRRPARTTPGLQEGLAQELKAPAIPARFKTAHDASKNGVMGELGIATVKRVPPVDESTWA